ncbi:hypothetical protein Tco_1032485 [Tanacetum coccineum]|uniref:Uncharacterized protein n=1 Tax=Tanacetum coccineum TaxID=301880 RepID=A0ABQ5GCS5_9ASTR
MDDDMTPDEQVQSCGDKDIGHDHIPTVNLRQNWWKPLIEDRPATLEPAWSIPSSDLPVPVNNWASDIASTYASPLENSLLAQIGDMAIFMDWFCKKQGITELKQQDLEGLAYEIVKVFHPNVIHLQYQMEECHKLLTDQVDESIIRHTSEGDRRAVRTHMRILSVVRIEVFSLYGYDYMKKIVLRRADLKEYTIAERDFKYLYPSDFEDLYLLNLQGVRLAGIKIALRRADNQEYTIAESDFKDLYPSDFENLYLLNLQGHLNHLPPRDMKILSSAVNLWIMNRATSLEFMHDYKILDSPRAVLFRDKYVIRMVRLIVLRSRQSRRDHTTGKNLLVSVEDRIVGIEKVAVCSSLRSLKSKCTIESRPEDRALNLLILPGSTECTKYSTVEYGNPARANIKQALGKDDFESLKGSNFYAKGHSIRSRLKN